MKTRFKHNINSKLKLNCVPKPLTGSCWRQANFCCFSQKHSCSRICFYENVMNKTWTGCVSVIVWGYNPDVMSCGRPTGTGRRLSSRRSSSREIRLRSYYFLALFVCDLMKTRSRQLAVMLAHSGVPLFKSESAELATNQSSKPNMHTVIYGASAQRC